MLVKFKSVLTCSTYGFGANGDAMRLKYAAKSADAVLKYASISACDGLDAKRNALSAAVTTPVAAIKSKILFATAVLLTFDEYAIRDCIKSFCFNFDKFLNPCKAFFAVAEFVNLLAKSANNLLAILT